jgi:hypothetical protein
MSIGARRFDPSGCILVAAKVARFSGVEAFVVGLEQDQRDDRGYGGPAYGTEAIFVPHAQVGPEPHQIHGGSPSLFQPRTIAQKALVKAPSR